MFEPKNRNYPAHLGLYRCRCSPISLYLISLLFWRSVLILRGWVEEDEAKVVIIVVKEQIGLGNNNGIGVVIFDRRKVSDLDVCPW